MTIFNMVGWGSWGGWYDWPYDKYEDDYSAMRWPSPEGFHVPATTEWQALLWILTNKFSMAQGIATVWTYLKMSPSGYRTWSWGLNQVNWRWCYWTCTPYSTAAYSLSVYASSYSHSTWNWRSIWQTIRSFKDKPTIPNSDWTVLYDGSLIAVWAGIFHNPTLWLISISWDWTTWYTIMDKNLWATTVYNNWDTLSEANCGTYFQWWNNYWFPFSWSVTTSSTQVDASNYWPGNYYYSNIYITKFPWDSSANDNLRWRETWVQQILVGEYVVINGVEYIHLQ